jgi:hypothetical protein
LQGAEGHRHLTCIAQIGTDDSRLKTIIFQIEAAAQKSTRCT